VRFGYSLYMIPSPNNVTMTTAVASFAVSKDVNRSATLRSNHVKTGRASVCNQDSLGSEILITTRLSVFHSATVPDAVPKLKE
jgi:hypothetical protein